MALTPGTNPQQGPQPAELRAAGAGLCRGVCPAAARREQTSRVTHGELSRNSGGPGRTHPPGGALGCRGWGPVGGFWGWEPVDDFLVSVLSWVRGCHRGGLVDQSPFTPLGPLHSMGGGTGGPDALEGPQPACLPLPKPPGDLQAPERLSNRHLQLRVPEHDEGLCVQGLLRALWAEGLCRGWSPVSLSGCGVDAGG